MESPETRYAETVEGISIAYQVLGDGPVDLVSAPGLWSNVEMMWELPAWGHFLRRLAALSRHDRLSLPKDSLFPGISHTCSRVMGDPIGAVCLLGGGLAEGTWGLPNLLRDSDFESAPETPP